ncbi:MAG: MOSC domain-containing protein [Mycobacteriaceae bacterium]
MSSTGIITAVCVATTNTSLGPKNTPSAIDKRPVKDVVEVGPLGLMRDHVCNHKHHGGLDQAVYAYAEHEAARWAEELGKDLPPGWFGENFRTSGIPVTDAVIGTRWQVGDPNKAGLLLEVTLPRVPCANFGHWAQELHWVKRFTLRADTGAYLRVIRPGKVQSGDTITLAAIPTHGVTARELFTRSTVPRLKTLLTEPDIAPKTQLMAEKALEGLLAGTPEN